ncbi:MAG TPA: hypothetical protein VIE86_00465 [Nitrososphaera sp.]
MVPKEKEISTKDELYPLYDDATLERMKRYYKVEDHDELLRYIKTHGMRRHSEVLD